MPTREEVLEHELTHLPYRSWCRHCVRGKGKVIDHRRQGQREVKIRELHCDYCFMGNSDEKETKCILVAKDGESKSLMASMVPVKGMSHEFPARRLVAFIKELGMEHCDLVIKHDQEPALVDLMKEVARKRIPAKTLNEESPVGSSASNGKIERGVQTVEGHIRVLKSALEERVGRVRGDHCVVSWLVEFAAVLVNRYEVGHDGKTNYERLRGKASKLLGLEFCEMVHFRKSRVESKLGKLDVLWHDGIFLGYRPASGEAVVGTKDGVFKTRNVRRRPEEERWSGKNLDYVVGVPWRMRPGDDREGETLMPNVGDAMDMPEIEMEPPTVQEKDFVPRRLGIRAKDIERFGPTAGCKGCMSMLTGMGRQAHDETCRKRMTKLLNQGEEGRNRVKASRMRLDRFLEDVVRKAAEGDAKTAAGAGRTAAEVEAETATEGDAKRRRTQDDEEIEMRDEEFDDARGKETGDAEDLGKGEQRMDVSTVEKFEFDAAGGVWELPCEETLEVIEMEAEDLFYEKDGHGDYANTVVYKDDRTGEQLDSKKVEDARNEELMEMERRGVWIEADVTECLAKTRKPPISVRWVDTHKGFGVHRSRLVARDFRPKSRVEDVEGLFAAMPPLEVVKFLLMHAATSTKRGNTRKVMFIDIGKAHLYAPMCEDAFIELPAGRAKPGKCGKLIYTLYGMRMAASNWEAEYSKTLEENGLIAGRASKCVFYNVERGVRIAVHGDDFVIEGRDEDLRWVESLLRAKYIVKMRGVMGPEPADAKEVDILNRVVRWGASELQYEADPRHVENILRDMGMETCNGGTVPGAKEEGKHDEEDKELNEMDRRRFRSVVARANYLAADRADIRFSVKELCRRMSAPTTSDMARLKKLCRYLRERSRIVQVIPVGQEMEKVLHVYVDSDYAGCRRTRRSSTGGCMMWNRCCLKTWSTTQTVVALSSGEAEYYAALKGASQGLGMQSMLAELGVDLEVVVHTDANACRGISGRQGLGKLRHLAVTLLWLQDVVKQRRIKLVKVPGTENPADAMTKYLSRVDMERCLKAMGFEYSEGRTRCIGEI